MVKSLNKVKIDKSTVNNAYGSEVEKERRNRILLSVYAWAYEVKNISLVPDYVYDELSYRINPDIETGHKIMDEFFKEKFSKVTGQWIYDHPLIEGIISIYLFLMSKKSSTMRYHAVNLDHAHILLYEYEMAGKTYIATKSFLAAIKDDIQACTFHGNYYEKARIAGINLNALLIDNTNERIIYESLLTTTVENDVLDPYKRLAVKFYNVAYSEVTEAQREEMKIKSLKYVYGGGGRL